MSLIDDLRILSANPPNMKDSFDFCAGETNDCREWEISVKETMTHWVKDVDAVLSVAGKLEELRIWREATEVITTDFEDEERKLVLLGRIIIKLEKDRENTEQLLHNIEALLNDSERPKDSSQFLQSEGVEWQVADRCYMENVKTWANAVEVSLTLANREVELSSWKQIRQSTVTVLDVYDYAEMLQRTLWQIHTRLTQELEVYVPDLAQVDKTPGLSQTDISDAYKMSELYVILHCYENSVRRLVERVFINNLGENWWDSVASDTMRTKVNGLKQKENTNRWLSPRGQTSPLYYLEWGDLVKLIRKQESLFLPYIGELSFVESGFGRLEDLRHIIAHNGVLPSVDDFQRVVISFRDWCRQIGNKFQS